MWVSARSYSLLHCNFGNHQVRAAPTGPDGRRGTACRQHNLVLLRLQLFAQLLRIVSVAGAPARRRLHCWYDRAHCNVQR